MKKLIYFFFVLLLFAVTAKAQTKRVAGTVRESVGPLAGASVVEKGTTGNGTTTDAEGRFSLTLKGNSKIVLISAVGFVPQEVNVATSSNVVVTLVIDPKSLEDVVVVGYGKQKKITLTGAVSTVSGVDIRQNPSASLQNSLAGRLPGFFSQQRSGQPGQDGATFYIRGTSTLPDGNSNPLILVDDIEFTYDQFARLDPNEIEDVSILKDASSTAIYGIKGANGVVLVSTRRGRISRPQITVRSEASLQQPTMFPKYLDAYETAKLYNQAKVNDGLAKYFSDEDLELYRNGKDPYGHPNNNWREILFKDYSMQSRNNLDVSGGTDKVKYFLSTGYLWQNGMLRNFGKSNDVNSDFYYKRYNYRSNLDVKVTKTTDLRLDLYGNVGETNSPYFESANGIKDIFWEYGSFLTLSPYAYPIYNPNGSFGYSTRQENRYTVGNIISRLTRGGYVRNFENNMNLVSSVNQKLDFITKGLSLKGVISYASSYNYNRDLNRQTHSYPEYIYNATTNTYTPRDASVYRVRRFFLVYNAGNTVRTVNTQAILSYTRSFGGHNVNGLALFNQRSESKYNSDNNLYSYVPSNFRGYSGRVGYNFKQRYLFEFNAAYNGSDRFVSSKRYGFFPAASVGWNLAEENFFRNNIKFVDNFKLRASYGIVGSDQLPKGYQYSYTQVYNTSGSASFGYADNTQSGITEGTLSNSEVTWEKEKKLDIGLDLTLFERKLTFTADYFNNNRYDILTTRGTVSAVFGQGLPPVNLGRVNNRGVEFELVYRGNVGKDLGFNVRANYSFAKNKILFMDEPAAKYPWMQATGNSSGLYESSASSKGMLYRWIGFYTQEDIDNPKVAKFASSNKPGDLKYADLNGDGVLDGFDMEYTGYPNLPNTTVGLGGGLNYKNFNLNFLFQGAFNFNVRGVAEAIQAFGSNMQPLHQEYWTPERGDNAKYPRLSLQASTNESRAYPSTFWSVSGNYIRLRSAEIGYALPGKLVQKLRINAARVYVNGYNLFSWSKVQKRYQFDPELTTASDKAAYPPQRMLNFGLTATF